MSENISIPPNKTVPKWLGYSFAFLFILGCCPAVALKFGHQFLASPDWLSQTRIIAIAFACVFSLLMLWFVIKGLNAQGKQKSKFVKGLLYVFTPFFGYYIGFTIVALGLPMLGAIILGNNTEVTYTVAKSEKRHDRSCSNPITLEGLPFVHNELCNFSAEFGGRFKAGDQVVVIGKGTQLGVFPKSARRVDAE